jgi:hypothetical protein
MLLRGWDGPALVGYRTFEVGRIQLLSGTHRLAAAIATQQRTVPVVVWPFTELFHIWGTDRWAEVMASGDSYGQQTSDQQIEDAVFGGELDWGK